MTTALNDPERRERVLDLLAEMARGEITKREPLAAYLERAPGRGPLFEPLLAPERKAAGRTAAFVAEARTTDPACAVQAYPTVEQRKVVIAYARRLRQEVLPAVRAEIVALARSVAEAGAVNVRVKNSADIMDKVERMTSGHAGRAARLEYSVGDVIDAVGARITVADTQALGTMLAEVRRVFGNRILELENLYLEPKAPDPTYRVVPMVVAIDVGGQPYTYELQLTTERASVAADLGHNTLYKTYVPVEEAERQAILRAKAEAAALEQAEARDTLRAQDTGGRENE